MVPTKSNGHIMVIIFSGKLDTEWKWGEKRSAPTAQ